MNVVFGCNKDYAKYVVVMLQSLFENNKNHFINLYVMCEGELDGCEERLKYMVEQYGNKIQFIKLPFNNRGAEIKEFWPTCINIDRYLAIDLLPEDVERFLMLDIDILVRGDLGEFYYSDFKNKYMIMCKDQLTMLCCGSDEEWVETLRSCQIGELDQKFGNCGVVLVNREIRRVFDYCTMLDIIVENQYRNPEQDFFNIHMGEYIEFIEPYEYNYLAGLGDYEDVIDKVKILHYALTKPWDIYHGTPPWMDLWFECAKRAPGCGEVVKKHEDYVSDYRYICWQRYEKCQKVLEKWMRLRDKGYSVFDGQNYSSVALYGAGKMCKHLLSDLKERKIVCKGIYDRDRKIETIDGIIIFHDLKNFLEIIDDVEVIIITAILSYEEIEYVLKEKTAIKIISLEKIIKDGVTALDL